MSKKSNILILGGDGYLGWPTAMHFSSRGHNVTVVDNYSRRKNFKESGVDFLTPTLDLNERAKIWHESTGKEIKVFIGDLSEINVTKSLFDGTVKYDWAISKNFSGIPNCVIHFAEQPSAPYSMLNLEKSDFTIVNNLRVTNNLMWCVKDFSPTTHIIKLGTMGEYGTPNIDIEEGWIDIYHKGQNDRFLFPRQASSIYHTSKIMDTDLLWFGVRTWGLTVTDLMQGPVYGIETDESLKDQRLMTSFSYDEIFGTVLNRFIVQSICNYPLTIYGSGNQKRGYLNLIDTLKCIYAAFENPPTQGKLDIYNQITEVLSVKEIALLVQQIGNERGHKVKIQSVDNPRVEKEDHYYNPKYSGLQELGFKPTLLSSEILNKLFAICEKYSTNINEDTIFKGVKW